MTKNITGVLTAIVTPFDNQGEFNPAAMRLQVQRQMRYGNGIFCNGTNGEFFVLHTDEKVAVTETCVDEVAGKVPVVGHIGEISTRETIKLGKRIAALGVDAVSVITPYFIPLKQEELIAHYTAVADALTVPVFLYNIPARTGNTLAPETVRTLADHPNIIGIKDSAGSYESLSGYVQAVKGVQGFNVLNGPDSLIHQGFVDAAPLVFPGWLTWHRNRSARFGTTFTQVTSKALVRHKNRLPSCVRHCTHRVLTGCGEKSAGDYG